MSIIKMKTYKVPTGHIVIINGELGLPLEFLSIGDYGKNKNIKADFMGLSREINGVEHGDLLSLKEKWVITISTQYGCSMNCKFCDVPKIGKGINATLSDLKNQIIYARNIHPEILTGKRLNIHFARMGEPSFNKNVLECAKWLKDSYLSKFFHIHPVVSTMMPKINRALPSFIKEWMKIKNDLFEGEAGLQLSINSTDENSRKEMFSNNALTLEQISKIMSDIIPKGRKITLNFALTDKEINPEELLKYFNPDFYLCKITPMHLTKSCLKNNYITTNGYKTYYPYKEIENKLKKAGYDVIVFIPSVEEDKSKITCGNVILKNKRNNKIHRKR